MDDFEARAMGLAKVAAFALAALRSFLEARTRAPQAGHFLSFHVSSAPHLLQNMRGCPLLSNRSYSSYSGVESSRLRARRRVRSAFSLWASGFSKWGSWWGMHAGIDHSS